MLEREIQDMPHVQSVFAMVGGHLSGGVISERPGTANIQVHLTPAGERPEWSAGRWVAELQTRVNQLDLPGARITVRPPRIQGLQFGVTGNDLSIGVMGDELVELQRIARELVTRLNVRVRLPRSATSDAEALGHVIIQHGPTGFVQLRDVATFSLGEGPAHIERENQGRILRVNGSINPALADVGTIMAEVEARLRDISMPEQYSLVIGVILLIGIVVNNVILLVEYIERCRARGLDIMAAVVEAGGVRLRPILMTTLTTVAGMLPLAIGMGAGADIMQPLALSVVGGLITAMLLTLFLVPCLYVIVQGIVAWMSRTLLRDRNPPALVDR